MITTSIDFQQEENILFQNFIFNHELKKMENEILELIIRQECNQKCDYCYITNYGKELYPEHFSNSQILDNLKLLLNYFDKKQIKPLEWSLFAGDLFYDGLIFDILDVFFPYLKKWYEFSYKIKEKGKLVIPTNGSFISDNEKVIKIKKYIQQMKDINVEIHFSFSTDGPYSTEFREHKDLNDEYFNKLFEFATENNDGFHPMISSQNVDKAIKTYDWFKKKLKEYNSWQKTPYMLEVRNNNWAQESIENYKKFLKHIFEDRLNDCNNDINTMAYAMFKGDGANNTPTFNEHNGDPIRLMNLSDKEDRHNRISCALQSTVHIRVGDLAIVPCHRTCYNHLIGGHFKINDEKTEIIDLISDNATAYIGMKSFNPVYAPRCLECWCRDVCIKGCLGAQIETYGDFSIPCLSVCNLFQEKYNYLFKLYFETGVLKSAKDQKILPKVIENIAIELGYDLNG